MHNPESAHKRNGNGRQVSFVIEEKRQPTYTDWMKERVDSDKGKLIYSHRMSVIEPVFGNLANKGLTKFSLRGKEKVQCQLKLFCLVHNIEKIKTVVVWLHKRLMQRNKQYSILEVAYV